MTPGTRIRHRITGKAGRIQWTTGAVAGIKWDDPLTSGPRVIPQAMLEVEQ